MSRPVRPWFRFYTEAMGDQKLRTLAPAQRWAWLGVLSAARMSPVPGYLLIGDDIPHTIPTLADLCALKEREVDGAMVEFMKRGMVEQDLLGVWNVPRFLERQYESDSSTTRTRKHRSPEHDGNVPRTPEGTHQRTETETEPSGGASPPPVQILVGGYIDDFGAERGGKRPSGSFLKACGAAVKRALADGEDQQDIARCLGVIAHESKNPGSLPYVLADMHAGRERRMR